MNNYKALYQQHTFTTQHFNTKTARDLAKQYGMRSLDHDTLDRIADKEYTARVSGGYTTKRSNRCDKCFTMKSKNGSCNC